MNRISRQGWGAPAPKKALQEQHFPVSLAFQHHTVTSVSSDPIADMHKVTNYNTYVDVPYHDVIHPDGTVLTGRYLNGKPALGAHTSGKNTVSVGIALLGRYDQDVQPSDKALEALAEVLNEYVSNGWLTPVFDYKAHSDAPYATACCGKNLKAQLKVIYAMAQGYITGTPTSPTPVSVPQVPQAPVSNVPVYPMLLMQGTKGNFVRQAQAQLIARGYALPKYGADGGFGDETLSAVKAFQKDAGLDVDGKVGKLTWNALFKTNVAPAPKQVPQYPGLIVQGSSNVAAVKSVQAKLGVKADGDFGKLTKAAVIAFQKSKGLDPDGKVGPNTWRALFS